jgi:hypothetical protein
MSVVRGDRKVKEEEDKDDADGSMGGFRRNRLVLPISSVPAAPPVAVGVIVVG